jgi:hypothetical protein
MEKKLSNVFYGADKYWADQKICRYRTLLTLKKLYFASSTFLRNLRSGLASSKILMIYFSLPTFYFLSSREVRVKGTREEVTQCIFHICGLLLENPPKGNGVFVLRIVNYFRSCIPVF